MYKGPRVPETARSVTLFRATKDDLIACEMVTFARGADGIDTVLRRAAISGLVEVGGKLGDYFADLLDENESMVESVALDANSYRILKTRWMRTRVDRP